MPVFKRYLSRPPGSRWSVLRTSFMKFSQGRKEGRKEGRKSSEHASAVGWEKLEPFIYLPIPVSGSFHSTQHGTGCAHVDQHQEEGKGREEEEQEKEEEAPKAYACMLASYYVGLMVEQVHQSVSNRGILVVWKWINKVFLLFQSRAKTLPISSVERGNRGVGPI